MTPVSLSALVPEVDCLDELCFMKLLPILSTNDTSGPTLTPGMDETGGNELTETALGCLACLDHDGVVFAKPVREEVLPEIWVSARDADNGVWGEGVEGGEGSYGLRRIGFERECRLPRGFGESKETPSRSVGSSSSTIPRDDRDDCERRVEDVEVEVVDIEELDAWPWYMPLFGVPRSLSWPSRRVTPWTLSLNPLSIVPWLAESLPMNELEADDWRFTPRFTMRSHFRLSTSSSASSAASWERNSRHLDSFCAMKRSRSACLPC